MKQFRGPTTTITVLEPLEWHDAPDDVSLPPGSYAAIPTLNRDEVNNVDSLYLWTIDSGGRAFVMGASQAYDFAKSGMLQIAGWSLEQLAR
jgi:hypothetical protein